MENEFSENITNCISCDLSHSCKYSEHCRECEECVSCNNLYKCKFMDRCFDCISCESCFDSDHCSKSENLFHCIWCKDCKQCYLSDNLMGWKDVSNFDGKKTLLLLFQNFEDLIIDIPNLNEIIVYYDTGECLKEDHIRNLIKSHDFPNFPEKTLKYFMLKYDPYIISKLIKHRPEVLNFMPKEIGENFNIKHKSAKFIS